MKLRTIAKVASRAVEVRLRSVLGARLRPYKALLELTSECNSRCTTCGIWKNPASVKKADIQLPEIESFLEGFGKDLVWLALSGGEVTLVEHFPAVIASARRLCPNLALMTFTTNGLLPEKALEFARCIRSHGFDLFVTVSLDGDPETHDRIRGVAGNYVLATRTLELLRADGFRAHYGITLGAENHEFVEKHFHEYRHDIKAITFVESGGIYRQKNGVESDEILKSLAVILKSYRVTAPGELIEWIYLRLAVLFFKKGRKESPLPCDVLQTSVHVRPNGDVVPCMFLPAIGNVKSETLPQMLSGPAAKTALRRVAKEECQRCWMNCYAPHSIMSRPLMAMRRAVGAS